MRAEITVADMQKSINVFKKYEMYFEFHMDEEYVMFVYINPLRLNYTDICYLENIGWCCADGFFYYSELYEDEEGD